VLVGRAPRFVEFGGELDVVLAGFATDGGDGLTLSLRVINR
jgi:hypothetical protein